MRDRASARDHGAVSVEYGILIAAAGALVLAVILTMGDQLVELYNLLVDKTLDERVNTTIVSLGRR